MRINPGKVRFKTIIHSMADFKLNPCGAFLKGPEKFSHPESQKISNRMITSSVIHICHMILDGYKERFPLYRKIQAQTPVRFKIQIS